jgi:hypothetical protein
MGLCEGALMGRPTVYTAELALEICRRLAEGKTLREVCRDEELPPESTVRRWVADDREGFAAHYARAREIGYHTMADEILHIADDNSTDTRTDEDGNEMVNHDVINRAKLRIDSRKWLLAKALPKIYGDRVEANVNHTLTIPQAFEDYIRSIAQEREAKVIDGSLATEGSRVEKLPAPVRNGSAEGNT